MAMVWLAPGLAAVAVVVLTGYLYLFDRLSQKIEDLDLREDRADQDSARKVHDLLDNLPLVRMRSTADREVEAYVDRASGATRLRVEKRWLLDLEDPLKDLVNAIVLVGFVVAAATLLAGARHVDVVRYLVFFLILRRAMQRFSGVLSIPSRLAQAAWRMRAVDDALDASDKLVVPTGTRPFSGLRHSVRVENLVFAYNNKRVLDGASCDIEAARTTYVVGATGSGKSTLFKLLVRLYDCPPGSIFFDGVDLRELRTRDVFERVGYCPSRPLLFDDTIRRNVSYGLGELNDADLWRAARHARVDDFVDSLEAKLDSVIGPRGSQVSVGEGQRLALMRLFLTDPDLILLDEATSGLDSATERDIWRELETRFAGRTILVIAHRLSMLTPVSPVIVMSQGRVVEQGERDQLLAKNGELARLWRAMHRVEPPVVASADSDAAISAAPAKA
jgi:ABC-type multidrug transport system fused ATPase/permease subunit